MTETIITHLPDDAQLLITVALSRRLRFRFWAIDGIKAALEGNEKPEDTVGQIREILAELL